MEEAMTKARLLSTLRAERRRWEARLAEVASIRRTTRILARGWSIKDAIARVSLVRSVAADMPLVTLAGRLAQASRDLEASLSRWEGEGGRL
jgi:hypothetical protein